MGFPAIQSAYMYKMRSPVKQLLKLLNAAKLLIASDYFDLVCVCADNKYFCSSC